MAIVPPKLAAKIDAKVAQGKVIPNWRDGWKFHSIWTYAVIFLTALSQGGFWLAAPAAAFWDVWPHVVVSVLIATFCVVGTVSRLRVQPGVTPGTWRITTPPPVAAPDDTDGAGA